eukprot:104509-Amphidinium_carterae.1
MGCGFTWEVFWNEMSNVKPWRWGGHEPAKLQAKINTQDRRSKTTRSIMWSINCEVTWGLRVSIEFTQGQGKEAGNLKHTSC